MKTRYQKLWFILLLPICSNACQKPLTSYLQLLPTDLLHLQMNYILSNKPLWQGDQTVTQVKQAIHFSIIFKEIYNINIDSMIINRMRSDLSHAKKTILEPFYPDLKNDVYTLFFTNSPMLITAKDLQDPFSSDNPKMFQKLLPLMSILAYSQIDSEWLKEFVMSKKCGGTLRKHVFINAMLYKNEYWVNYLWNNRYRKKAMLSQLRNRPFLRMAIGVASTGYEGIHKVLKTAHDKIIEQLKAAKAFYPG